MKQSIVHIALIVRDYDEAIGFYTQKLMFDLIEDTYQPEQDKRWVVVSPPGSNGVTILLARASNSDQEKFIGNQSGGRVFLFLNTDDFWRDFNRMKSIRNVDLSPRDSWRMPNELTIFITLFWTYLDITPRSVIIILGFS